MNPQIKNVALVSRYSQFALTSGCVLDGTLITADGIIPRGAVLVKQVGGKYKRWVTGDPALVAGSYRLATDEIKVEAAKDAFVAGYFKGFFSLSDIIDANPSLVLATLVGAALIEANEIELK